MNKCDLIQPILEGMTGQEAADVIQDNFENLCRDKISKSEINDIVNKIIQDMGLGGQGGSVNPEDVVTIISNHLVDQLVNLNWAQLNNYIGSFIENWLQQSNNIDYLFNLIKDKINQLINSIVGSVINNKFEELLLSQSFIDAVTNIVNNIGTSVDPEQIKEIVYNAIQETIATQERVIANALARHEQDIILLKNNA